MIKLINLGMSANKVCNCINSIADEDKVISAACKSCEDFYRSHQSNMRYLISKV